MNGLENLRRLAGLNEGGETITAGEAALADTVIEAMRQYKRHVSEGHDKRAMRVLMFVLSTLAQMAMKVGDRNTSVSKGVEAIALKVDTTADKLEKFAAKMK